MQLAAIGPASYRQLLAAIYYEELLGSASVPEGEHALHNLIKRGNKEAGAGQGVGGRAESGETNPVLHKNGRGVYVLPK